VTTGGLKSNLAQALHVNKIISQNHAQLWDSDLPGRGHKLSFNSLLTIQEMRQ
jgi:hypothetical protein